MNWGEIQIESLKKMFLSSDTLNVANLNTYKQDKKYKTYLDAMPQACNEAINYILENGKPYVLSHDLVKTDSTRYDLKTLIPKFKKVSEIVYDGPDNIKYATEGNGNYLSVKNWNTGDLIVYYESYIDKITNITLPTYDIPLDIDLVSLIPLYIAGELYKDDDIAMSTQYLNEFMSQVNLIGEKDTSYGPNSFETIYSVDLV